MWTVRAVSFLEEHLNFWESTFSSLEVEGILLSIFWDIDRKTPWKDHPFLTRFSLLDVMLACKKENAFYNYVAVDPSSTL